MAISFVGGITAEGLDNATLSASLTGLTGGSGSTAATGDIVIVIAQHNNNTNTPSPPVVSSSGYTNIASLFADDSNDSNTIVEWKIMGATPDTTVALTNMGLGGRGMSMAVHVWRGVDTTTPIDVTTTTATGTNTGQPNCPTITPTTSGAYVIACGGQSTGNNLHQMNAAPTGYSNFFGTTNSSAAFRANAALASFAWSSGAEDPSTFGVAGDTTSSSWCAATVVLRPSSGGGYTPTPMLHMLQMAGGIL